MSETEQQVEVPKKRLKKKKKRKVVIADQRSDSEAVKGDKHESGNTSKLKQSENVNMGMKKVKSKMKSKPAPCAASNPKHRLSGSAANK